MLRQGARQQVIALKIRVHMFVKGFLPGNSSRRERFHSIQFTHPLSGVLPARILDDFVEARIRAERQRVPIPRQFKAAAGLIVIGQRKMATAQMEL